jgi:hypothetical protein
LATGTRTSSKKTSFRWCPPSSDRIGRIVMPGVFRSISRKEMPSCRLLPVPPPVRTNANTQSAQWAVLVQIFCPLTM